MIPRPDTEVARRALREADPLLKALDVYSLDRDDFPGPGVGGRRRLRRLGQADPVDSVALTMSEDGVLLWSEGLQAALAPGRPGRRGARRAPEGEIVEVYQFEKLRPNQIGQFLAGLDGRLNGNSGLRAMDGQGTLTPVAQPPAGSKRRLLFVHGILSSTEGMLSGLDAGPQGAAFRQAIAGRYDEVLAFDHPTLSVSPVMNAFDLARLFANATGPLDIVAHSRGGVVARWFLEGFGVAASPVRVVVVGSPIGGTSLASPARLRDSLSLLTNLGTALKTAGAAASVSLPFLAVPVAILRIASSVTSFAAKTPVLDAAIAMIPGVAGLSMVAGNPELERICASAGSRPPQYFVVRSNFEPTDPAWKFWRWFRKDKLLDTAADWIFPDANDLVVDTGSMGAFAGLGKASAIQDDLDFGTSPDVHHTNYFAQQQTLDFILASLT